MAFDEVKICPKCKNRGFFVYERRAHGKVEQVARYCDCEVGREARFGAKGDDKNGS